MPPIDGVGLVDPDVLTLSQPVTAGSGDVIENLEFVHGVGDAATRVWHVLIPDGVSGVTIRNCRFVGGSVDPAFYYLGAAIRIRVGVTDVLVENCEFVDVARMGHAHFTGGGVRFRRNTMTSDYATQVFQFAECVGDGLEFVENHAVCGMQRWSTGQNRDQSMQDFVNCYGTSGTPASPVLIEGNYLEGRNNLVADPQPGGPAGGLPTGYGGDFSVIGAGIIVGDNQGAYCTVRNNFVASAGTHKIVNSGGDSNRIEGNVTFGDGTVDPWAWAGYGFYWQGWGGVDCPTNGYAAGNVTKHTSRWGVRQDWGVMGGCEPGPINSPPFYTSDEALSNAEVYSRWVSYMGAVPPPEPEPQPEPEPEPESSGFTGMLIFVDGRLEDVI